MELPRDYPSFAKAAGRLMKPVAAELGFARVNRRRFGATHFRRNGAT